MFGSISIRWFFVGFTIFENDSAYIGLVSKEKNGQYAPDQIIFSVKFQFLVIFAKWIKM